MSTERSSGSSSLCVLAIIESRHITGPAKNLLEFAKRSRVADQADGQLDFTIATYTRSSGPAREDALFAASQDSGISARLIRERRSFDLSILPAIAAMVRELRPDVIQTHNSKSHFIVRLLGLHRKVPWIAFHHGYTATDLKMRAIHRLDYWSLRGARKVVTVCGAFRDQLVSMGVRRDRVSVHHNAVMPFVPPSEEEVATARRVYGIPLDKAVLVTVGRLSKEKAHVDLIRAVKLIPETTRPHLVVVGEGVEKMTLEKEVTTLGLTPSVTFAGHHPDIRPFLAMADLFVLPSHSEGSPNAMLEAMAAGLPVVATAVGGVPEIATDRETAILVRPSDLSGLAASIQLVLGDSYLAARISQGAREVSTHYSYSNYQRSLSRIYRDVVTRGS